MSIDQSSNPVVQLNITVFLNDLITGDILRIIKGILNDLKYEIEMPHGKHRHDHTLYPRSNNELVVMIVDVSVQIPVKDGFSVSIVAYGII